MPTGHTLGFDFPREGFVQRVIEDHFAAQGFHVIFAQYADFICEHSDTGERWHIEAKGETSAIGLDFRTGLGQLVQRATDEATKYGLAVPDTAAFRAQCAPLAPWVRRALRLHWLLVGAEGTVRVVGPEENI